MAQVWGKVNTSLEWSIERPSLEDVVTQKEIQLLLAEGGIPLLGGQKTHNICCH